MVPPTERYAEQIAGVVSCFDRIVITVMLPGVCYAEGMTRYLHSKASGLSTTGASRRRCATSCAPIRRGSFVGARRPSSLPCCGASATRRTAWMSSPRLDEQRVKPTMTGWPGEEAAPRAGIIDQRGIGTARCAAWICLCLGAGRHRS